MQGQLPLFVEGIEAYKRLQVGPPKCSLLCFCAVASIAAGVFAGKQRGGIWRVLLHSQLAIRPRQNLALRQSEEPAGAGRNGAGGRWRGPAGDHFMTKRTLFRLRMTNPY